MKMPVVQLTLAAVAGFVAGFLWQRQAAQAWERAWWHDFESCPDCDSDRKPGPPIGPGGKISP
jgi:hypothetical protein